MTRNDQKRSIRKRTLTSLSHLQLYVNELEFRYNSHMNSDISSAAIRAC